MGESVKYVTGGYKLRARPIDFATMGDYLDMFTQKLGTIDRIAQRIIKEQSGKGYKDHLLSKISFRNAVSPDFRMLMKNHFMVKLFDSSSK